ncbi:MAG: ATP-binding protein [Polyangiales bacterium]
MSSPRGPQKSVRLRTTAGAFGVVLVALSLLGAVLATVLTKRLAHDAADAEQGLQALRAVEQVRVMLLRFAVDSDRAYITKAEADERTRSEREALLMRRIVEARATVKDEAQRRMLDEADRDIQDYLVARRQAEQRAAPLADVVSASYDPLQTALATAQRVVEAVITDVQRVGRGTRKWGGIGADVGVMATVAIVLGFVAVVTMMHRFFFLPLFGLTDAIRAFARGDRQARAPQGRTAELDELATTFNELADGEVQHETERLTFLAGVAHDLRNPLAALRVATQLIRPDRALPPEQRLRATMELVDRQITRLERMVGDFLDASHIESGHLELKWERRDLHALVDEAVELHRAMAAKDGLHELVVIGEGELPVECDPVRIEQVLDNLLSNAMKYSPRGGEIIVSVHREDDDAVIAVTDRGIGIAPDDLARLFEPFHRVGASREAIPGLGLGLSVSRRLVEAHRGKLEVTSEVGVGSTFSLRIPLALPVHESHSATVH